MIVRTGERGYGIGGAAQAARPPFPILHPEPPSLYPPLAR